MTCALCGDEMRSAEDVAAHWCNTREREQLAVQREAQQVGGEDDTPDTFTREEFEADMTHETYLDSGRSEASED